MQRFTFLLHFIYHLKVLISHFTKRLFHDTLTLLIGNISTLFLLTETGKQLGQHNKVIALL